jgi:hypothetical protein
MAEYLDIEQQLKDSTSRIKFSELKTEILSEVIILVNPELKLLEVAKACAGDNTELFKEWLSNEKIQKPEQDEIEALKKEDAYFECCIVKPFLFLQRVFVS